MTADLIDIKAEIGINDFVGVKTWVNVFILRWLQLRYSSSIGNLLAWGFFVCYSFFFQKGKLSLLHYLKLV